MNHANFFSRTILALAMFGALACSKQDFGLPAESRDFASAVTYNNKVDIVMIMDNSTSMLQYQNKFANETPGMLSALNRYGLDYHIAVVTTDMRPNATGGKFVGSPKYLTNGTSGLTSILQSRVVVGQAGSDLTRGMDSVKTAMSPTYLTGDGAGFFRDDALLAIIVVTNGEDYSSLAANDYVNYFNALKPPLDTGARSWTLNFIGVTSISGNCSTSGDFKEAGLKYMSIADSSGGVKASICETTLSTAVSNVRARIVEILSAYHLDRVPNLATVVVTLNGAVVPQNATNGWTYDAAQQAIVFHGTYLPGVNDSVKVDFKPATGT